MKYFAFLFLILVLSSCNIFNALKVAKKLGKSSLVSKEFTTVSKFEYKNGHIFIKAKIQNQNELSNFIFDTGAGTTISPELSNKLNLKKTTLKGDIDSNDALNKSFPMIDSLIVSNIKFLKIGAVEVEPSKITDTKCKPFEGIIGANILKKCIWQLNYQTEEITATDKLTNLSHIIGAIKIPFSPASITGSPILSIALNDSLIMNWILDTGFNGFITFSTENKEEFINKIPKKDIAYNYSLGYNSIYGKDTTNMGSYLLKTKLNVGGHAFDSVPITFGKYKNISREKNGVIGNKFLENFIVTIDWKDNNVYLQPIQNRKLPDNQLSYGINYGFDNGKLIVGAVWKNSDAEKQGIKVGDQIILFNEKKATNLSQEEICNFFDENQTIIDDNVLNITLLKNNQEINYKLKAYDLFSKY